MANELEKQTEELKEQTRAVNEMTDQIKGMSTELVASQTTIARTYQQGISGVSRELGQMSSSFSYGLSRVSSGLNVMAQSLNFMSDAMCKRLDALHNIANNPLLTQAQELYRLALVNYNKGFFEEALDNVKQAIEKYKTDYMSWFLLGHIYTFGKGEFSNVINLEEAISAFIQAAKYNSPNVTTSQDGRLLAAEIYFYWGMAQYLQSSELLKAGKNEDAEKLIAGAATSFEKSFQYSDKMLEALFYSARCKARQNQKNAAIASLERLFLLDRNYCISVYKEADFNELKNEIDALIIKLRHKVFIEAEPKYNKIKSLIDQCKTMNTAIQFSLKDVASQFTEEQPYFDILDYNDNFGEMISRIETEIRETIERRKQAEQLQKEREQREEQERKNRIQWAEQEQKRKEEEEQKQKKQLVKSIIGFMLTFVPFIVGLVLYNRGIIVSLILLGGPLVLLHFKDFNWDNNYWGFTVVAIVVFWITLIILTFVFGKYLGSLSIVVSFIMACVYPKQKYS